MFVWSGPEEVKKCRFGHFIVGEDYRSLLTAWLILVLACKGVFLAGGYSVDDYSFASGDNLSGLIYGQGRYLQAALHAVIQWANLNVVDLSPVTGAAALVSNIVLVCAVLRFLSVDVSCRYFFGAGAIMLTHPYTAEIYTWRVAMPAYCVTLLSMAASLELIRANSSIRTTIGSACIVVAGLFTYQIALNYLVTVLFFSFAITWFLWLSGKSSPRRGAHMARSLRLGRVLLVSVSVYVFSAWLLGNVMHIAQDERSKLINVSEFGSRCHEICEAILAVYWRGEAILPRWLKVMQFAVITVSSISIFGCVRQRQSPAKQMAYFGLIFLTYVLTLPLTLGVIIFFRGWWPVPRVLSHVSLIIGISYWLTIYIKISCQRRLYAFSLISRAVGCAFVIGSIGVHLCIFADQYRINAWDSAMGNRIVARIENLPRFPDVRSVHVVNSFYRYPSGPKCLQGDMNISSLGLSGLNTYVLNLISGYKWEKASAQEQHRAEGLCRLANKWPASDSVFTSENVAIVCLPD
jgi:hypothetical protein